MVKRFFLPIGLVVAITAAVLLPGPGIWMKNHGMVQLCIVTIFLVNGWTLDFGHARIGGHLLAAFALASVVSLVAGPVAAVLAGRMLVLDPAFAAGLIVMSTVPVTLSSAIVITEVSRGNTTWALFITVAMNLFAVLTVPFMLKMCLERGGEVHVDAGALLLKLILVVILPLLIGHVAKRLVDCGTHPLVRYVPSTCVLFAVYAGFALGHQKLAHVPLLRYPALLVAILIVHGALMALAYSGGKALRLKTPELKTLTFTGSQKTLPLALSIIALLGLNNGAALVPCLLFHFSQLIIDSGIAAKWAKC